MRTVLWVAVAVWCTSCVKTERDYQLEYAKTLTPKEAPQRQRERGELIIPPQPPRILTVRVYVDLDYQAQVLHWNERVLAQLASASDVLRVELNAELKVVSVETWNRHSAQVPIADLLPVLEREDPAKDVDFVFGFVSSLEIFTESQEKLGVANLLGRHAVLRAMDNAEEHRRILSVFTKLSETEQTTLYRERKLHKERSVVLHEFGHLLGAPHDLAADSVLNANYAAQRSRFTPAMLQFLVKSLELRDAKADVKTRARALGEFLGSTPDSVLALQDRAGALEALEQLVRGDAVALARANSQEDRRVFETARRLDEQGKPAEALAALEPLLGREPPLKGVLSYACQLSGSVSLRDPKTTERCRRSIDAKDDDGPSLLVLAQALNVTKDLAAARTTFIAARERFDARPNQSVEASAALGVVARSLGFVTWAERYSSRAMGRVTADEVLEWVARRRKWFGLPSTATSPEARDEPAYLDRFLEAQNLLTANRLKDTELAVAALEKEFPELPGPMTLRCELAMRRHQDSAAQAACERAVKAYPESLEGRYLLGVLASLRSAHRVCIEHLEWVVANDPSVDDAWQRLVKAYAALGDVANRERAAQHRPK